jgi:hypothetical protein
MAFACFRSETAHAEEKKSESRSRIKRLLRLSSCYVPVNLSVFSTVMSPSVTYLPVFSEWTTVSAFSP